MLEAPTSPYLVPFDGSFDLAAMPTKSADDAKKSDRKHRLAELTEEIAELQAKLYAVDQHAVLLLFQAMDAAGKDGTIKAVLNGVDPAGIQHFSFKQPSPEELDHD